MRPELASDPQVRRVDIDGLELAYTDEGAGPCVLALHGLPGSVRDFRWLGAAIGARVRLVRIDLPGFGASRGAAVPREWSGIVDVVQRFAARVIAAPYVVLGHSFGAPLATMVAATAGQAQPCGLAWLAPVGLRPHRMIRRGISLERIRVVARLARMKYGGLAVVHAWRLLLRAGGFPSSMTPADVRRTLDVLSAFEFGMHRDAVARLEVPSFAAWTLDDPFVEPAVVNELCDASAARVRMPFATGGHNLQKTQAVELAAALADFVGDCVPSRTRVEGA